MALIKCKECGHELSSKADKCPHCGKKRYKPSGCLIFILFTVAVVILSPLLKDNKSTSNQVVSTTSTAGQVTTTKEPEPDPFTKMTVVEHIINTLKAIQYAIDTDQKRGLDEAKKHLDVINIYDKAFSDAKNFEHLQEARHAIANAIDTGQYRWLDEAKKHVDAININDKAFTDAKYKLNKIEQAVIDPFIKMTPAEHLVEAKKAISFAFGNDKDTWINEARRHIGAINKEDKEYSEAKKVLKELKEVETPKINSKVWKPKYMEDVCPSPEVIYCKYVGKMAHNSATSGPTMLRGIKLGQIIGVAWRPEGSIIDIEPAMPSIGEPKRIHRAPQSSYYYIIDDGTSTVQSGGPFLRECGEIDAK